ncbi:hypothetical protein JYK22_06320, partial [Nonomuraea sp. RK-328]|nr:hypothetical protein [Nonomuraea sp. RK-328]
LRALERWAAGRQGAAALSKSTIADMLKGTRFPKKAVLVTFVRACGVSEVTPWRMAWERIATAERDRPINSDDIDALRERVLAEAHRQADTVMTEAKHEGERVLADARQQARKIVTEAKGEAARVVADAH